jgi:hypothetical protein
MAGVDSRGLPKNNEALVNSTIAQAASGTGLSLPANPNTTRADMTVLQRGQKGARVSDRYQQALYRALQSGMIDLSMYEQGLRTGAPIGQLYAAKGITQETVDIDPEKDLYVQTTNPDGSISLTLAVPARKLKSADDLANSARNTIGEGGLRYAENYVKIFNTDDDPNRGKRVLQSFIETIAANESKARTGGYDLSNVNDVALLLQRYGDITQFKDAYNQEFFVNWNFSPDFTQDYGSIADVMFDPNANLQQVVQEEGLKDFRGETLEVAPLRPRNPEIYNAIRQQRPDFANASDEEIEAALQAAEAGGL